MHRFYSYYRSTILPAFFHSYLIWQIIIGCLSLLNGPTTHSFPYHQSCGKVVIQNIIILDYL